jgi:hypothetical protein
MKITGTFLQIMGFSGAPCKFLEQGEAVFSSLRTKERGVQGFEILYISDSSESIQRPSF